MSVFYFISSVIILLYIKGNYFILYQVLLFYFVSSFIIRLFYTAVLCVSNILFWVELIWELTL